ncbi:RNA polymerase sigma-70 factor (ECF subfamily) [Neorhizobium sp. R1-B]|jgi:RNA polymerase sigma factor (sigma-70 family)|uniref:sigma-70 family RNA polymerase sigma factor n=1 Tax=Neorhizobium sp. R1-B TaxID=2485162 RepID=UPI00106471DF|nr:sigma-70 family RNA polymerase sigma factor [Neorhizobium sp. R1-B]TDX82118.1 RNA polymerase sigma-70 factor (ECF subfamily) [Neorhizobium sp. R1-B]
MTLKIDDRHSLYLTHRSALVDYAARILGSREAAEDIVQEAYLRLAPGKMTGESARQTIAYLYRIVRNLSFDVLKRRKIEYRGQANEAPFWTVPQPVQTPEQTVMFCDEVRIASEVLNSLPSEIRTAVEMYRFGGHTLDGIAQHLGISVATAHRHVRTAMMRIATALDRKTI